MDLGPHEGSGGTGAASGRDGAASVCSPRCVDVSGAEGRPSRGER